MFAALFESGVETRCNPRQVAELRTFGEFINRLEWRAQREPAGVLLDELLVAIDYRGHLYGNHDEKAAAARWQNVTDFIDWLRQRAEQDGSELIALAQTVALLTQLDRKEDAGDAVQLSTIHAAKGLEYPHVYIVGCEEGILPHHGGVVPRDDDGKKARAQVTEPDPAATQRIEEERRLMYVAVTRAQRSLHLSWCRKRKRAREFLSPQPSRFITEMLLDARPDKAVTITGAAARGRLGALREMLAAAPDSRHSSD
ncbi:MAG: ATP-dependent helicase [Burkholderiaceae bacterium]